MADVFISYRRADASDVAGRIADRLKELPQVDRVFLDVESIGYGEDFIDKINHVIGRSAICLLLIGSEWVGRRDTGSLRIQEDGDFVRMEAMAAMNGKVKVIPVLLNDASMPTERELPPELVDLTRRNAFPLRTTFFSQDIEVLFDDMFGQNREKPGASLVSRIVRRSVGGVIWGAIAGALLFAFTFILKLVTGKSLNALFDYNNEATALVMLSVPLVGFLVGFWWRGRRA